MHFLLLISSLLITIYTRTTFGECDVIPLSRSTTTIPTGTGDFTYQDGATYDDKDGVIAIRSGEANKISSVKTKYCFQTSGEIDMIEINYRYAWDFEESGEAATAKLILEDDTGKNVWESESFDPFDKTKYKWDGTTVSYSPLMASPKRFSSMRLGVSGNIHFKIEFTNHDRNVYLLLEGE
eukprot:859884_1